MRHMPTLRQRSRKEATAPMRLLNHLMFATLALFMIQQQLVVPGPAMSSGPWVAQALHFQPRTPPPTLDPEQLSMEDADWLGDRQRHR